MSAVKKSRKPGLWRADWRKEKEGGQMCRTVTFWAEPCPDEFGGCKLDKGYYIVSGPEWVKEIFNNLVNEL